MSHGRFSEITADGVEAIREGRTTTDSPPKDGGRWGLSVVFRPTGHLADRLDLLTAEAIGVLGADHWRTGSHGAAHITVRALEPYSERPLSSRVLDGYVDLLTRAAPDIGPVSFDVTGMAVSAAALMARVIDVNGKGGDLRRRVHEELGGRGWLENRHFTNGRDPIWYVTLVHFTGPLDHRTSFLDWFTANEQCPIGTAVFADVHLCRWRFDTNRMAPEVVATIALGRVGHSEL